MKPNKARSFFLILSLLSIIFYLFSCESPTGGGGDKTAPALSGGSVSRTSDTAATISFTTDEAGTAYYFELASGAAAPTSAAVKSGTSLGAAAVGANSKGVTLTAGARDIYVAVEDKSGNISEPLKIEAAAYTPPGKEAGAVVSAPTLAGKTHNSITIAAVAAPDNGQTVEYARSDSDSAPSTGWQNELIFSGLSPNTTYYIFARSKENTTHNAGAASASLEVTTDPDPSKEAGAAVSAPALASKTHNSITIVASAFTGDNSGGQTIEYARNLLDSAPSTGWQDELTFSGLNPSTTYYIFARSKSNDSHNAGTASASLSVTTDPAPVKDTGAAVSAPALAGKTHNSITIVASTFTGGNPGGQTIEYARNLSDSAPSTGWQGTLTFSGLSPSTTYYIFARSKENTTHNAGTASASLSVTTDPAPVKDAGAAVSAPTPASNTHNSITITAATFTGGNPGGQTIEYARSDSDTVPSTGWQDTLTFSGLDPVTTYYIFARSKENDTHNAGTASASLSVTTDKAAGASVGAPTLASKTYNTITIVVVSAPGNGQTVEYAKNDSDTAPVADWQDGLTFSGLSPNTTYYIFARSKENATYYAGTASTGLMETTESVPGSLNPGFYDKADPTTSDSPIDISAQSGANSIAQALSYINGDTGTQYTLVLGADVYVSDLLVFSKLGAVTLTITSDGTTERKILKETGTSTDLFRIGPISDVAGYNQRLVIDGHITLVGNSTGRLIEIRYGGSLDLKGNAVLRGQTTAASGGAISTSGSSTNPVTITMSGNAVIRDNIGQRTSGGQSNGAVYLANYSTFTMSGNAAIKDNQAIRAGAAYGGGVYIGLNSSFIMNGGEISGNAAIGNSVGNALGGGIYIDDSATASFVVLDETVKANIKDNTISHGASATYGAQVYKSTSGVFTVGGVPAVTY
ncbi:MAG: hypothetical protein FWG99_09975 [Treponema sp.]|nr:hypothetical protein [Treponema sp.]